MSDTVPNSIRPGMKHVATAGEVLLIDDINGEQIAIDCRDDPKVIEVLDALDAWMAARKAGVTDPALGALFLTLQVKFNDLPMRVYKNLPSFKGLGIQL